MTTVPSYSVLGLGAPVEKSSGLLRPPRLNDLNGKVIAELWDYLFKGDVMFPIIRRELLSRFPGVEFRSYQEFGNTHGADEKSVVANLPALLLEQGCDAVISAVGC